MKRHLIFTVLLAAALTLSCAGCASSSGEPAERDGAAVFENRGVKLTVPAAYRELVIVSTDEPDLLFSVSEKASVEAAARLREAAGGDPGDNTGEGWLFGIARVGQQRLQELMCADMSGVDVFAREGDGGAFLFVHPTDVRLVRDGENAYGPEDTAAWQYVQEWAASVKDSFIAENGLMAYTRSNTDLDMALSRLLYRGDTDYELGALDYGALAPGGVDPTPWLQALTELTYEWADSAETPEGEYIVLRLPAEGTRFDFFLGDGSYVREVTEYGETLYRAERGADVASVMRAWYDALAAAQGVKRFDSEAYDAAVRAVLDEFAALTMEELENYDESAHPELPWYTAAIANTVRNDLYYGFYDFDGNGVPELLIAAGDDSYQVPEAVYAFDGARMRYLCREQPLGERAHLTWNGDLFAVHGSGGAAVGCVALYRIAADGFGTDLVEIMDYEYRDDGTVTYTPELGNMSPEEFAALDLGYGFELPVAFECFARRAN